MSTPIDIDELLGRATGVILSENDVVFGRGGFTNKHHGNIEYLKLLKEHEEAYMDCKRKFQKLLSLCIIHQLRCKGVRFLKKDEKSGSWKTVQLSQCRLKISQRLRERAPFIKLEQLKATDGLAKVIRPAPKQSPVSFEFETGVAPPPLQIITVSDASSDEESLGFEDHTSYSGYDDIVSLRSALEGILQNQTDCNTIMLEPLATPEFQPEACSLQSKRGADNITLNEPQRKRLRKVSMDDNDYANMLMKDASLLEDISVASFGFEHEHDFDSGHDHGDHDHGDHDHCEDCGVQSIEQPLFVVDALPCEAIRSSEEDLFEYLEVLF